MQPTKHMDPSEDELITHIKDNLMSHEEPYVPGAWEKFKVREEKKRPLIFWIGPLSSAAAVLLIATGLYFFINKTSDKPVAQVVKTSPYKYNGPKPGKGITAEEVPPFSRAGQVKDVKAAVSTASDIDYIAKNTNIPVSQPAARVDTETKVNAVSSLAESAKPNPVVSNDPAANNPPVASVKETPEKKAYSFQEFLNNESRVSKEDKPVAIAAVKDNKWEMGVMVAPSFGNTKRLNMGYGVSMDYAVSDKISLGSGISYNELAASRDVSSSPAGTMDSPSGYNAIARSTKNLESVEAKISGIDIPFEVKYHFSKKLYANVGVSAFAIIDHQQNNSYVEQKLVERETLLTAGNKDSFATFLVAEKTTEKAPEAEVSNDKYLGFYNFSFGYKQKISKSKSVSIEPFMKVPMKEVSKDNLRLMGTGVRLKLDF